MPAPNFRPLAGLPNGRPARTQDTTYRRVSGIELSHFEYRHGLYVAVAVLWLGRPAGFRRTIRAVAGPEFSYLSAVGDVPVDDHTTVNG